MSTDNDGKNATPKSIINRYGGGWGGSCNPEMGKNPSKEEKHADTSYIRVQSDTERLVKRGRWYPT